MSRISELAKKYACVVGTVAVVISCTLSASATPPRQSPPLAPKSHVADRIEQLRKDLTAPDGEESSVQNDTKPDLLQWYNWGNWNNWRNWGNWGNWGNWPNW